MRDVEGKRASLERNLQSGLRDMSAEQDELGGPDGEDDAAGDAAQRKKDAQIQVCSFWLYAYEELWFYLQLLLSRFMFSTPLNWLCGRSLPKWPSLWM